MTLLAIAAVVLAAGTYFVFRIVEESHRLDQTIADYLMSIPPSEWDLAEWEESHEVFEPDELWGSHHLPADAAPPSSGVGGFHLPQEDQ